MDDAEVVDQLDGYWVVLSLGRRYFLRDSEIASQQQPHIGLKGLLGYVQRPASKVLMFTDGNVPL